MMDYNLQKGRHSVHSLHYHLVVCTKYRRNLFKDDKVIDELKMRVKRIAQNYEIRVDNQEVDDDHIHILFTATPKSDLIKFVNAMKGATARAITNRFPQLKEVMWNEKFWSPSYFLATTGEVTLDQLKKYVENQGENGEG